MKFQIVYDKPGRIRFRCGAYAFDKELETAVQKQLLESAAVKKAEALVMFCCHDDIFHACRFCLSCPFLWVVQIRIKVFKIEIVVIFRDFFVIFDPFVARGHGV